MIASQRLPAMRDLYKDYIRMYRAAGVPSATHSFNHFGSTARPSYVSMCCNGDGLCLLTSVGCGVFLFGLCAHTVSGVALPCVCMRSKAWRCRAFACAQRPGATVCSHALKGLALPRASHFGEIAVVGLSPAFHACGSASPFADPPTTARYLSVEPMAQCVVHALKGLACRARGMRRRRER